MKNKIFTVIFFVLCFIPLVTMFMPDGDNKANEAARTAVSIKDENGGLNVNFLGDLSDAFDKNFGLRDMMISTYHKCIAMIFGESAEDKVIFGKDGWLFYTETLDDFQRTNNLSDAEIYSICRTLELIDEYLESKGTEFIFTIAPNKNSLYGDMMPKYYKEGSGESNAQRLSGLLKGSDITYVDLFEIFRNESKQLYMKTDSHWTTEGAGLAADGILKATGKEHNPYYGSETTTKTTDYGDLYKMLYPSFKNNEKDTVYTHQFLYTHSSPMRTVEDNFIRTQCDGKEGTLFVYRDSFGNTMYPFLAEEYGKSVFCRLNPYNLALAENEQADTVVIEIVERNIDWLLTKPPVFPSPERFVDVSGSLDCRKLDITESDEITGYNKIEGVLSESISAGEYIYISAGDSIYEAIPCKDGAFVAYIPTEKCQDTLSVSVVK